MELVAEEGNSTSRWRRRGIGGGMKSYVAASAKRKWKWLAAAVLALVFFSLVVPLEFLLGLHRGFPSGYLSEDSSSLDSGSEGYDKVPTSEEMNLPVSQGAQLVDDIMRKIGRDFSKDTQNITIESGRNGESQIKGDTLSNSQVNDGVFRSKGVHSSQVVTQKIHDTHNKDKIEVDGNDVTGMESMDDETRKPCELEYGSYCLWSVEHKEKLEDNLVKKLKDQLFVARSYFPSIAKMKSEESFSHEVKQNIQDHEQMLSDAIVDADLPTTVDNNIKKMEEVIIKAKSFKVECHNVDRKLGQILDSTEDEAQFHMRQGAFLFHLAIQTMPKSLHCLSMKLTVEYFRNSPADTETLYAEKLNNPDFQHYVIFSKNVLASSVTVNSTVMNAKVSGNLVFHLLTDEQNYYAMKFWFSRNFFKDASVRVLNINKLGISSSSISNFQHIPFSEEFRISIRDPDLPSSVQIRTEYISIFGHSHFLLPDIFKNLKKVVILDDDIVVQKDLSTLWSLDLKGKVNGAVQFCKVTLGQLKRYLGAHDVKSDSCTWMSGLNVIDLQKWRDTDITATYKMLTEEVKSMRMTSWRAAALPISLLAFHDLTYALNDTWLLSGFGKDYEVSKDTITKAAVLHYNGNMKPWLELGIPKYKSYWRHFLPQGNQFMDECNVNL